MAYPNFIKNFIPLMYGIYISHPITSFFFNSLLGKVLLHGTAGISRRLVTVS